MCFICHCSTQHRRGQPVCSRLTSISFQKLVQVCVWKLSNSHSVCTVVEHSLFLTVTRPLNSFKHLLPKYGGLNRVMQRLRRHSQHELQMSNSKQWKLRFICFVWNAEVSMCVTRGPNHSLILVSPDLTLILVHYILLRSSRLKVKPTLLLRIY